MARVRAENFYLMDNLEDLQMMMDLMRTGKIKAVVDSRYQLSRAGEAWDRSMGRHTSGKIVVIGT